MSIQLVSLSYMLGAQVLDVDLAAPMSEAVFREIHQAFLDHNGLLLFRDQIITREQHIAFSRRFGELDTHAAVPLDRHPDLHEMLIVANQPVLERQHHDQNIGQSWHSDVLSKGMKKLIGEKVKTFEGLSQEESRPLIDYLIRHATRPQFGYRHRWQTNELLMWDNRCTMHLALGDFDQCQRRHLERTTVAGKPSGPICALVT